MAISSRAPIASDPPYPAHRRHRRSGIFSPTTAERPSPLFAFNPTSMKITMHDTGMSRLHRAHHLNGQPDPQNRVLLLGGRRLQSLTLRRGDNLLCLDTTEAPGACDSDSPDVCGTAPMAASTAGGTARDRQEGLTQQSAGLPQVRFRDTRHGCGHSCSRPERHPDRDGDPRALADRGDTGAAVTGHCRQELPSTPPRSRISGALSQAVKEPPVGFEPTTFALQERRSDQLS